LTMQVFFIFIFCSYINFVYLREADSPENYLVFLLLGVMYPVTYDIIQIKRIGFSEYWENPWSKADFINYVCNFLNFVF
jgi:hypothetical protein